MSKNEIPKNFWEKKIMKKCKKYETIKKISVTCWKKVFQNCYDNFFNKIIQYFKTI
jgi:hypothetical protein